MDRLNEPDCPIPLEKMALLLGRDEQVLDSMIENMPKTTRAELAVYCFGRCHTREVGLHIASRAVQFYVSGRPQARRRSRLRALV